MSQAKILETTRELVESKGLSVSVREIAAAADVNVAAINYHFGSKNNLINHIIIEKLTAFKYAFDKLEDETVSAVTRLKIFLNDLIELLSSHRELSAYILNQVDLFKTRYEYMNYLEHVGYSKLGKLITNITNEDEHTVLIITEQLLAAIAMGYIQELENEKRYAGYVITENYNERIDLFINNYFYKYIN